MELRRLLVTEFKGAEVEIDLRSVVVLFGPNDSGKSNILEAAWSSLTWSRDWRTDPLDESPFPEGSPFGCQYVLLGNDALLERLLNTMTLGRRPARGPPVPQQANEGAIVIDPGPLEKMLRQLKESVLSRVRAACPDWLSVKGEFERLLDRRFNSRWFSHGMEEVWWLPPPLRELDPGDRTAAEWLLERSDLWPYETVPLLHSFARTLIEHPSKYHDAPGPVTPDDDEWWMWEFGALGQEETFPICQGIRVDAETPSIDALLARVESEVLELTWDRVFFNQGIPHSGPGRSLDLLDDPDRVWMERGKDGWNRVNPVVGGVCEDVSKRATEIAPRFVTRDHSIVIDPVPATHWTRTKGTRIRLALESRVSGRKLDIRVVGSGLAVWAGYAAEEALRRIRQETSGSEESTGTLPLRVLVMDEPERHLHPNAQREAAHWLATQLTPGTTALLATHGIPFLNVPREDVAYYRVRREADGTRAEEVTGSVLACLKQHADEAGVSLAEVLQLTRAVLLVEGMHDEMVVGHFFGPDLEQARVEVLPIGGVLQAMQLVELHFLARNRIPLIAMFDSGPSSKEEEQVRKVQEAGTRVEFVALEEPDVISAVPDEVVRETLRRHVTTQAADLFPGWEKVKLAHAERQPNANFKTFTAKEILKINPRENEKGWQMWDDLVGKMLRTHRDAFPGLQARPSLARAINTVLARLDLFLQPKEKGDLGDVSV